MQKAFYYIGSNNATHDLEEEKILAIVSRYFDGFTAFEVVGYWKGKGERTLKVEVITDEPHTKLVRVGRELKERLEQESVLLEVVETNAAFIH